MPEQQTEHAGPVVIVGAGPAGATFALALRTAGHDGPITIVGDEPHLPYDRPPLSKAVLSAGTDTGRLALRNHDAYAARNIVLRLGAAVTAIDRQACLLRLNDGNTVPFGTLVLATGAAARRLPIDGTFLAGVHHLRTIDDAVRLRDTLQPGRHLVVIGGGYLGLEVAASARKRGVRVTVLERRERLLQRVAGAGIAEFFHALHQHEGVQVRTGCDVVRLTGDAGGVRAVVLADGSAIDADQVLVAIGGVPNDRLATAAGIGVDDGILTDADGRTSDPRIWAIGDVARRQALGGSVRLESLPNANLHARHAAAILLGTRPPAPEPPWFWTEQYDVKLQTIGRIGDADEVVIRGTPRLRSFAAYHLRGERVVAIELVNRPGELLSARRLVADGGKLPTAPLPPAPVAQPVRAGL